MFSIAATGQLIGMPTRTMWQRIQQGHLPKPMYGEPLPTGGTRLLYTEDQVLVFRQAALARKNEPWHIFFAHSKFHSIVKQGLAKLSAHAIDEGAYTLPEPQGRLSRAVQLNIERIMSFFNRARRRERVD
jgi:hypothetical protein